MLSTMEGLPLPRARFATTPTQSTSCKVCRREIGLYLEAFAERFGS